MIEHANEEKKNKININNKNNEIQCDEEVLLAVRIYHGDYVGMYVLYHVAHYWNNARCNYPMLREYNIFDLDRWQAGLY